MFAEYVVNTSSSRNASGLNMADPFHKLLAYSAYVNAPDKDAINDCDDTFVKAFNSLQASHVRSTDTSFTMDLKSRKALISYRDVEELLIPRAIDQWKTIPTRYDYEYWRRQLMARRQMVRDRFRRNAHKLMLKDKLKVKGTFIISIKEVPLAAYLRADIKLTEDLLEHRSSEPATIRVTSPMRH